MFFEVLVSLLGKHDVAIHDVKVTETGEVKIDIDFSEHDKVFEDKIEELDRKRKIWIDKAVKWQQESEKLKKQIAELESKEDEKPTKYITVIVAKEINGQEYVRLEDFMSVVNDLQAETGT